MHGIISFVLFTYIHTFHHFIPFRESKKRLLCRFYLPRSVEDPGAHSEPKRRAPLVEIKDT